MGRKNSKQYKNKDYFLNEDTDVGNVYNITENVKNIKKLYETANDLNCDLTDVLIYWGEKGLDIGDIAIIAGMPKAKLQKIMDKGENDFELGQRSIEAGYYRAYITGMKAYEVKVAENAGKREPMKMLGVINPSKYSDKVTDKYELPSLHLHFGDKEEKIVIEEERNDEEDD